VWHFPHRAVDQLRYAATVGRLRLPAWPTALAHTYYRSLCAGRVAGLNRTTRAAPEACVASSIKAQRGDREAAPSVAGVP
jgi:hypothetical protein